MVEQVAKYLFDGEEGVLRKYWASDGGGGKKIGPPIARVSFCSTEYRRSEILNHGLLS